MALPKPYQGQKMGKQFWISGVVLSIAALLGGFVVHGLLLGADYMALPEVYRGEAESQGYFHWMLLAHVFIGFAMTWVYRQGRTADAPLGQGIRFGVALACLSTIPWYLIYLAVLRIPTELAVKQIAFDVPVVVLLGVLLAYLNRK
jgi:hypothetical protein